MSADEDKRKWPEEFVRNLFDSFLNSSLSFYDAPLDNQNSKASLWIQINMFGNQIDAIE